MVIVRFESYKTALETITSERIELLRTVKYKKQNRFQNSPGYCKKIEYRDRRRKSLELTWFART